MSEKTLVADILVGNERSLRAYWRGFSAKTLSFIKKRLSNSDDAEEILQDTFLASLESLRDFDFRCSLSTFICSIAQHKIVDYYRKRRVKQIFLSQMPQDLAPLISQFLGPEEAFDAKEVRLRIRMVFRRMRPHYRKILVMKYIEDRSVAEIAEDLAVTIKSAESALFRARMAFVRVYHTV